MAARTGDCWSFNATVAVELYRRKEKRCERLNLVNWRGKFTDIA